MSPQLSCIGFFRTLLICSLLWTAACTDVSGGSATSGSEQTCSGDGGLVPTPIGPQALQKYSKFSFPKLTDRTQAEAEAFPRGMKLLAIVNEKCVLAQAQAKSKSTLTQKLRAKIEAQSVPLEVRSYEFELPTEMSPQSLKAWAESDSCLLSLSENLVLYPSTTTVNDPLFSSQKHLTAIEAPDAWDTFYSGLTSDVVVAIIDDGIELTHSDLSPTLWVNTGETAGNGIDDDGNGYVDDVNGYNFVSNLGSPAHEAGKSHGSHVAGLVAAVDNNSIGITGVMGRNVKIMALNVNGPNGGATIGQVVDAINYAVAKGAKVINMSLGAPGVADPLRVAMANAVAAGVFVAVAAGNDDVEVTDGNFYVPMGYARDIDGAMSVGSVDATSLAKSSFSNFSTSYVEIGAPGSDATPGGLLSTVPANTYGYMQGTSMASPVLAGAAALYIGWATDNGFSLTPAQVESALGSSAAIKANLSTYFTGGRLLNLKILASSTSCL